MLFFDVGYRGKNLLPIPRQDHSFGKKEAVFGYRRKNLLLIPNGSFNLAGLDHFSGHREKN